MLEKFAYSINELAKLGPICRANLYVAVAEGRLKARKAGRSTIVLREDYETFLRSLPERSTRAAAA